VTVRTYLCGGVTFSKFVVRCLSIGRLITNPTQRTLTHAAPRIAYLPGKSDYRDSIQIDDKGVTRGWVKFVEIKKASDSP